MYRIQQNERMPGNRNVKKDEMELLAPAGNFECLKAAVANGADAVYLGGEQFNAREGADNFTRDALEAALTYAGERGVKVYITLNTLTKDSEMDEALQFAGFVYEKGADAVIVQDIGLASLLRRNFPDISLHASTQMTITNSSGIRKCEEMGISRVVLARELTLEEIEVLSKSGKAELEVFVHGALCICYSGQCLMSSFIGGRSGNRGRCAQPCRLPWSIRRKDGTWSEESYLISPKDLMGLTLLPGLRNAGVSSLKIEGRMKSPEYVAVVTGIYRKYLDRLKAYGEEEYRVDDADLEKLLQIFNRGGFTAAYLKGARNDRSLVYPVHPKNRGVRIGTVTDSRKDSVRISLEKSLDMGDGIEVWDFRKGVPDIIVSSIVLDGKHVRNAPAGSSPWVGDMKVQVEKGSQVWRTYSKPLMLEARESFERGEARRVPLKAFFRLREGERASLVLEDPEGHRVEVFSDIPAEKAENRPLDEERIIRQIRKTGDTPYEVVRVRAETDQAGTLPVSSLNAMRREAIERISGLRRSSKIRQRMKQEAYLPLLAPDRRLQEAGPALTAFFHTKPQLPGGYELQVSRIYLPLMERSELESVREAYKGEIFIWTPNIVRDREMDGLINALDGLKGVIDGVSAANPGTMGMLQKCGGDVKFHADYQMNLINSYSLALVEDWGAASASVSPELRLDEAVRLVSRGMALEAQVYGRVQLMTLEYCPASILGQCGMKCAECGMSKGLLRDRKNKEFPYIRDCRAGRTGIFSPEPVFMDQPEKLLGSSIRLYRLAFADENVDEIKAVTGWFHKRLTNASPVLSKSDQDVLDRLLEKGASRGHWFKGV
ncbi:MAG: U32 family peptidase [Clostridiaceae bacterium]|nr:U32 family peptidase [Clostridiaceae bacterium]